MIKASLFSLFILFCLAAGAQNSMVHRKNRALVDSTGREIRLRGVNLGGWLLWEEWIWGGGFHSESEMREGLAKLVGVDEMEKFRTDVYANFMAEADIREIAAQKFNVVRIPFNHRLFELPYEGYTGAGWNLLDSLLGWCEKHGVYAVLDMHAAPGGQSPYFVADPFKKLLWGNTLYRERTVALWKAIAKRYSGRRVIAGYDLLNEPAPKSNPRRLLALYEQIIAAIREVDRDHLLFLEGINFAQNFRIFKSLPDRNMAFSFHFYTWFSLVEDVQDKVGVFGELGYQLNVPVWCGEWGENKHEVIRNTLFALEPAPLSGWCYWTWKKAEGKFPALVAIPAPASWKKVIDYLQKPGINPEPSKQEALQGMQEFIEAIPLQNCRPNPTLLDIITNFKH